MASVTEAKTYDVKRPIDAAPAPLATPMIGPGVAPPRPHQMETSMDQMTRTTAGFSRVAEDAADFSRGNVEALTHAGQAYMTGLQELSRHLLASMQSMAEQALETGRALGSVKSLKEATDLQTTYARTAFERALAEQGKLQAAMVKLTETAFAPLTARMTLAMEKATKPVTV